MTNDNEISYLEAQVRRKQADLDKMRNASTPDQSGIAALESELKVLRQKLHDLESRKRSEEDRARRAAAQKKLDNRRQGIY